MKLTYHPTKYHTNDKDHNNGVYDLFEFNSKSSSHVDVLPQYMPHLELNGNEGNSVTLLRVCQSLLSVYVILLHSPDNDDRQSLLVCLPTIQLTSVRFRSLYFLS